MGDMAVEKYMEDKAEDVKHAAIVKYIDDNEDTASFTLEAENRMVANPSEALKAKAIQRLIDEDEDGNLRRDAIDDMVDNDKNRGGNLRKAAIKKIKKKMKKHGCSESS